MRKFGRTDANQAEIVAALQRAGATVKSTASMGDGFPDLVCGFRGYTYLMEIKDAHGKLTPDEQAFFADWQGHVRLVRDAESALRVIGAV